MCERKGQCASGFCRWVNALGKIFSARESEKVQNLNNMVRKHLKLTCLTTCRIVLVVLEIQTPEMRAAATIDPADAPETIFSANWGAYSWKMNYNTNIKLALIATATPVWYIQRNPHPEKERFIFSGKLFIIVIFIWKLQYKISITSKKE